MENPARLTPPLYAGWQFTARYVTGSYLGYFPFRKRLCPDPAAHRAAGRKSFTDRLFAADWKRRRLSGAFDGQRLAAIGEGSPESWSNRYRISNLCVLEEADRRRGLGRALMDRLLAEARRAGAPHGGCWRPRPATRRPSPSYHSCGFAGHWVRVCTATPTTTPPGGKCGWRWG